MGENKLPKSFKVCATGALWGGMRSAESGGYAKFEQNQKKENAGVAHSTI
ncbi:MAG: hypothetical protein QXX08_06510 [Candidatus Bathyarchaeia archaeon]